MAQRDPSVGEDDPTAAPLAQSRIVTEAAPLEPGDPMASIRPQLPESPPLLAPTLELSNFSSRPTGSVGFDGSGHASAHEPTLEPQLGKREQLAHPTHATGPIIAVIESDALGQSDAPEAAAYQLRRQIGVGGMGEVWEAQQRELGRTVALKRLRDGKQSASNVRLFKSEARLTAILDHPNIVTVHELGRDQAGRMFYTMKMIEGTPWSEVMVAGERHTADGSIVKLELRDHLDILVEVSQAIAFAHSRGVIHRDIKPGNVMIGDYGEIQVVDWGLAVALHPIAALGRAETWTLADLPSSALVCGTPAYMSPETATAQRERIGTATDVYLLGAVLFHLLYGRPPHKGKSVDAVISKAKVNAWLIPEDIPGRLRPWDALLRPVITQALASDPADRYADADQFREALSEAIRNYESAKIATRAQEELVEILDLFTDKAPGTAAYQRLAAMIARLEAALESWPRNLAARQALARARLELARHALANGDLALTQLSLDAFDKMPTLPEPTPGRVVRRLTVHPADGTLISAPAPTESLVAAGTSSQWASSAAELGRRSGSGSLARTMDPAELVRASELSDSSPTRRSKPTSTSHGSTSVPSVEIQQESDESLIDEAQQFQVAAARLRMELAARERVGRRRRVSLWLAMGLIGLLGITAVWGQAAVYRERNRARAERDKLSKVLLHETANTVEAQLDVLFQPVDGALTTALAWARAGDLDLDDPTALNHYYMPLLRGLEAATSTLRADTAGNEYMLLREVDGWRTRMTRPVGDRLVNTVAHWNAAGDLQTQTSEKLDYDPTVRAWYIGGAALRSSVKSGEPTPVHWTEPYIFFTTKELGISVSAPVTSPSGREWVLAFDLKLGDISSITGNLPRDIDEGQVFVLDEKLRVLALPRETNELSHERRAEMIFTPILELDDIPISRAAVHEWQELGHDGPFKLELGDGSEDNFWVGFRRVDKPRRPHVWIGVVVPESHFLE